MFVLTLWRTVFLSLFLATVASRLYGLELGNQVCWDEAHFGRMAGWYINRTLFFDVHPPLGKMMIAGMGYITGYNASFTFWEPGNNFTGHNVLGMRYGSAVLGSFIIPTGFLTVWEMTGSLSAASLGSMMLLFDTGLAALSRFILLDQPMLLSMALSLYTMVRFRKLESEAFSPAWWFWLSFLGVSLWATISIKFVGLFIVLYVGAFTAYDLWTMFGDISKSWDNFAKHFLARAACLICLPVVLYILLFYLHLSILAYSGPGDGYYTPLFQSTIKGTPVYQKEVALAVAHGSVITLRGHQSVPCGYLHSHWDLFPKGVGAEQQMVSTYMHRDDNNKFIIKHWGYNITHAMDDLVRHGDLVTLQHLVTGRNLHSHSHPAIANKNFYQVTGYGDDGEGDENDVWRIEIVDGNEGDVVNTMTSRIKLRHYHIDCLLTCVGDQLPKEWGYGQIEVTCSPWRKYTNENLGFHEFAWIVEENTHEKHAMVPINLIDPGFLYKFIESHERMFYVNKRLGGKPDPHGPPSHDPRKWPTNEISQKFCPHEPRVTLLGNPIIWWLNLALLVMFPMMAGRSLFKQRRTESQASSGTVISSQLSAASFLFLAWAFHYLPFFMMYRTLYIHHYYPAFYFSCLLSGVLIDLGINTFILRMPHQIKPLFHLSILVGILSILTYSYLYFSPLVYGMSGGLENQAKFSNSSYHYMHWQESWDL